MKQTANTSLKTYKVVQVLAILAAVALKPEYKENDYLENFRVMLQDRGISEKDIEELRDFYNSTDWEIIPEADLEICEN